MVCIVLYFQVVPVPENHFMTQKFASFIYIQFAVEKWSGFKYNFSSLEFYYFINALSLLLGGKGKGFRC